MTEASPTSWLTSGTVITAVLTFFGTALASLVAWLVGLSSQRAPQQEALNHTVTTLQAVWQTENVRLSVRISEIEHELEITKDRLGDALRDKESLEARLILVNRLMVQRGVQPFKEASDETDT